MSLEEQRKKGVSNRNAKLTQRRQHLSSFGHQGMTVVFYA